MRYRRIAAGVSGIAFAMGCQHASAQSSVTLYGMTEITLRYLTNDNAQNDGRLFVTNGAIINSHVGLSPGGHPNSSKDGHFKFPHPMTTG